MNFRREVSLKNLVFNPLISFSFIIILSLSAGCSGGGGGNGVSDSNSDGNPTVQEENNTYYRDADGDGYGDLNDWIIADSQPEGYVTDNTDCNDDDETIYPDAQEICGDGVDQDCDTYDKNCTGDDVDGDGYKTDGGDCNDNDSSIHPGAIEICGDGIDQDCDGEDSLCTNTYYLDSDGDGYGDPDVFVESPVQPDGYVTDNTDCDDTDASINPGMIEICEDGIDQNCDGYDSVCTCCDDDDDGDGYTEREGDCDDTNSSIHPGAIEICGDGIDQDCDGLDMECPINTYYQDADGDGYGNPDVSVEDTIQPDGYVTDNTDCDDTDASIHPGAVEIIGDGIDQNCNGIDDPLITFERTIGEIPYFETCRSLQQASDGGYIMIANKLIYGETLTDIYLVKMDAYGSTDPADGGWEKSFGSSGTPDSGNFVQLTPDGGYIFTGVTYKFSQGTSNNVYLVKTDANGSSDPADGGWETVIGGNRPDHGWCVQPTADNGYIITGLSCSFSTGMYYDTDAYLIKTDANGSSDPADGGWERIFGDNNRNMGFYVQPTSDGGYIMVGYTLNFIGNDYDIYLIKTDAYGSSDPADGGWEKRFGGAGNDYGYCVQETSDGGYIVLGNTTSFDTESYDIYLIKTDAYGSSDPADGGWETTIQGLGNEAAYYVEQTLDGGYILSGWTAKDSYAWDYDVYLVKTDAFGSTDPADGGWTKMFGGIDDDWSWDVRQTMDGGYVLGGSAYISIEALYDMYIIKTDSNGDVNKNYYRDADGDGYGDPDDTVLSLGQPDGYTYKAGDCNDSDPSIAPYADDPINDGIDQNCDGCDGECPIYYKDADGDGYGDVSEYDIGPVQPDGYVLNYSDCDDDDASIHPGAEEICDDGIDNNCDGSRLACTTYYADTDGDGYGDPCFFPTRVPIQPPGYVTDNTDCDDSDPDVHPGADEIEGDGIDSDCDGTDSACTNFEYSYKFGYRNNLARKVLLTDDGGYMVFGVSDSFNEDGSLCEAGCWRGRLFLNKRSSCGISEWVSSFSISNIDNGSFGNNDQNPAVFASDILQVDDGYVMLAYKEGYTIIVKADFDGNMLWESEEYSLHKGHSITQTADGGFIILTNFMNLIKTDANGVLEWRNIIFKDVPDGYTNIFGYSILQTADGGYIAVGSVDIKNSGTGVFDRHVLLVKTDANGDHVWDNSDNRGVGYTMLMLDDGYVLAGGTHGIDGGVVGMQTIKTDFNGNLIWKKVYDIDDGFSENGGTIHSISMTSDGGFILLGDEYSNSGFGGSDFRLIKTDNEGNPEWDNLFGKNDDDTAWSVKQSPDGGYVMVGGYDSHICGSTDGVYLVKTNPNGNLIRTYYRDADGDGYGNPDDTVLSFEQPEGYSLEGEDCDDTNPYINPGACDPVGDGIDQNCNGQDGYAHSNKLFGLFDAADFFSEGIPTENEISTEEEMITRQPGPSPRNKFSQLKPAVIRNRMRGMR